MPPFYYETPRLDYTPITTLLARRGDIAARGQLLEGQAAANAIGAIGGAVAALPDQFQRDAAQTQALQFRQLQLDDLQQARRSRNIFEAELRNPANFNPDGTINDKAVSDRLRQQDVGAWEQWQDLSAKNAKNALDTAKAFAEINEKTSQTEERAQKMAAARQDYLGRLAFNAGKILEKNPGDPLHARDTALATIARAASDRMIDPQDARQISMQLAQASPDQIGAALGSLVPPELKGKLEKDAAETAKAQAEAAQKNAEAENLKKYGRTTPGTPEEQYLQAISTGDTATAGRILKTIQDTANAKRDPAQAALAAQLGGLRADEARQRLDALKEKNKPEDIGPDIQTTVAGRKYLDLSQYQGDRREKARAAAAQAGVIPVSKENADALQNIDAARMNQQSIMDQIHDLLPSTPAGRAGAALTVPLSKVFQTNDQIAAFNSWRSAAIQTLRATAGSKGLRINRAEILQSIENDLPKLTDTLATAQQKRKNIERMLENIEKSILVRDRSVPAPMGPEAAPFQLSSGLAGVEGRP